MEEKKYCAICGKEIEHPKKSSKTCGSEECMRKRRIQTTCAKYVERRDADPNFLKGRREKEYNRYQANKATVANMRRELLEYKTDELIKLMKIKYPLDTSELDEILEYAKELIIDNSKLNEKISELKAELKDAKLI